MIFGGETHLKGRRFGVPALILEGAGIPFRGIPASESADEVAADTAAARLPLRPETREAFVRALEGLSAEGATIIFDDSLLSSFAVTVQTSLFQIK